MGKEELIHRLQKIGNEEEDFKDYVSQLLELKMLDGTEVNGIAKLIVSKGIKSLSEKQLYTFAVHGIHQHYYVEECKRCGGEIPWDDMIQASTEYGRHSYCQHVEDKDE